MHGRGLIVVAFLAMGADGCPNLVTQTGLRTRIRRETATITVKVTNAGTTDVDDAGLALDLPLGVTYESVKVKPKPSTLVEEGTTVAWTGVSIDSHKTRTFRINLAFDNAMMSKNVNKATFYAGEVVISTFTGAFPPPLSCETTTMITVRRLMAK